MEVPKDANSGAWLDLISNVLLDLQFHLRFDVLPDDWLDLIKDVRLN